MITENNAAVLETSPYDSFSVLKDAHSTLLKRYGDGETSEVMDEVLTFISRASATGALLDGENEREASQSLLDYWMTVVYRAKLTPPDATLAEFDPALSPALDDDKCPYRGLNAFQESDKELFFGRERGIELLLKKLKTNRILFVDGPSGSGKSSIVLAGLVPALKADVIPGSANWRFFPAMVPGSNPLKNLARALGAALGRDASWIDGQAEAMEHNHAQLLETVSSLGPEPAVLVVDQFEEAFTLCLNDAWRNAFVNNLIALAKASAARHQIILTLRTDYNTYLAQYPELMKRFEVGQIRVMPLTASDLRAAIEEPAKRIGLKFEEGVVDNLVRDILGEPEGLPLLQFTLLRLWKTREDKRNRITLAQYRKLGGARRALALTADEFYHDLTEAKRVTLERIMLRLALPSGNLEVLRNPVRRATLYFEDPNRVNEVIDALWEAGLVRITQGETPANDKIEIAHEALVRHWPRLVEWIEKRRISMRQRLRLTVAAEQWLAHGKDEGGLLGGSLLTEALEQEDLNDLEKEFVQASQDLVKRQEEQKEAVRRREEELINARMVALQQRADEVAKSERRLRQFVVALAVLTIFALGTAAFGLVQANRARKGEQLAETNRKKAEEETTRAVNAGKEAKRQEDLALKKESEREEAANKAIAAQKEAETAQKQAESESDNAKRQTAFAMIEKRKADEYSAQLTEVTREQTITLQLKNEREAADEDLKKKRYEDAIGRYSSLIPQYKAAKDLRGEANTHSQLSIAHHSLAVKLERKGDTAGAKRNSEAADKSYQDGIKILNAQREAAGKDPAKLTPALWDLAQFYVEQGKIDDADKAYQELLTLHESNLARNDYFKRKAYNDVVETMVDFYREKKRDPLEQLYLRVLNKKKSVYDAAESDEVYFSLKELAQFYRDMKSYSKVIPVYLEVLSTLQQIGEKHPEVKTDDTFVEFLVDDTTSLGDAYANLTTPNLNEAEKYYSKALEVEKSRSSLTAQEKLQTYDIQVKLAEVLGKQKKHDSALKNYDEAIAFYQADAKSNIRKLALSLAAEARIYFDLGSEDKGMDAFRKAVTVSLLSDRGDIGVKENLADILINQIKADHAAGSKLKAEAARPYFARAEELTGLAALISSKTLTNTNQSLVSSLAAIHQAVFKSGDVAGDVSGVANLYYLILSLKARTATRSDYAIDFLVQELEKMNRESGGRQNTQATLIDAYKLLLDIKAKSPAEFDTPTTYATCNDLGQLYENQGKYLDAAQSYQKGLDIVERVFGKDNAYYVVESLMRLAKAYRLHMDYKTAENNFVRAKSNLEKKGQGDTLKMADVLEDYAELLAVTNRGDLAKQYKDNAQRIRLKNQPKVKS
jgi:hypothetical protein